MNKSGLLRKELCVLFPQLTSQKAKESAPQTLPLINNTKLGAKATRTKKSFLCQSFKTN